ncbi:MAG TPA: glycosyltransferase family 9 protein [bacterium]|nr:glycosyltransferase family 9 protein [bacterium]
MNLITKAKNIILFVVTYPVYWGQKLFFLNSIKSSRQKILFIQLSKMGDLICTTPIYRLVKMNYPTAEISVLVGDSLAGVLRDNPHIDKILTVSDDRKIIPLIKSIRQSGCREVIIFTPSINIVIASVWAGALKRISFLIKETGRMNALTARHFCNQIRPYLPHQYTVSQYIDILSDAGIDIKVANPRLEKYDIFWTKEEEGKARSWLTSNNLDPDKDFLVGVAVVAGNQFKVWPLEKFVDFSKKIIDKYNVKIITIGTLKEKPILEKFVAGVGGDSIFYNTGFSINESAALFSFLRVFVSADCGQFYLAHAAGTPGVNIIGPIDKLEHPPLGNNCEVVDYKVDCQPCSFGALAARECRYGTSQCLLDTTVEDVMASFEKIINFKK